MKYKQNLRNLQNQPVTVSQKTGLKVLYGTSGFPLFNASTYFAIKAWQMVVLIDSCIRPPSLLGHLK